MSDPIRVQAPSTVHTLSWRERRAQKRRGSEWQPGPFYQEYWRLGGAGCWLQDESGRDIWAAADLDFDRKFWKMTGYAHPPRWVDHPRSEWE